MGVSGPGVNIIVHSQTQSKTRTEGLMLPTSLAWLIIWTDDKDDRGDSPKGIRRGLILLKEECWARCHPSAPRISPPTIKDSSRVPCRNEQEQARSNHAWEI
ncbi:hypothetical protein J4Q44_G00330530 [Coregonus suidteri]|uniref:Uncharacterized protein n=1 Tax=Coregonus suidteri TaxID=861788 RepID=A0AAN8KY13_9TELE